MQTSFEQSYFYASYLIRYRLIGLPSLWDWLATVWDATTIRTQLEGMAATSAGQYNVSVSGLNRLLVPLPPEPEQIRVVAEVERRLSVVQELEATVEANLMRAERLRQAILKRAFEGRLVPQDPADEPASALLERLRGDNRKDHNERPRRERVHTDAGVSARSAPRPAAVLADGVEQLRMEGF
jgi:type I restriction enzyme S subunit